jgi:hypothetical protein
MMELVKHFYQAIHPGGTPMLSQATPCPPLVSPAHVWAGLTADLRLRAINLMAQLALNCVAAQSEWPRPEVPHASPTPLTQNSR